MNNRNAKVIIAGRGIPMHANGRLFEVANCNLKRRSQFAFVAILFSVRAAAENPLDPGLCGNCVHARQLQSDRGSRFLLCQLFLSDSRFEKYPRLPVAVCDGYRPATPPRANDDV